MSNKNQSSIEWLVEKIQQANPSFKFDALIRQAKAMHEQEIINSVLSSGYIGGATEEEANQYYNETYGDNTP